MENSVKENWYEDFFQGLTCEIWENAIPATYTEKEVEFLVSELNLKAGDQVLDIPCGFGRHAIEFAKLGFQVTGIDISETFLKGLKDRINAEGLSIRAIQADILHVQIPEKFAGAVCLGNSFGYFDFEKMKVFVEKVAASLIPGARFIINSGMVAECILPNLLNYAKNKTYTIGEIVMDVTNIYNVEESYMVSKLLYTKGDIQEEHIFRHFVFTLGEIKRLLALYGCKVIANYGSIQKEPFKLGDQQVYIVAEVSPS